EYEVARLYSDEAFVRQVRETFDGDDLRLHVHLSPPLLAPTDKAGRPRKMTFSPWMFSVFRVLARLKGRRGTPLDIFGYTEERRTEHKLIADYETMLAEVLDKLTPANHHVAVGLAAIPKKIR